MIADGAVWTPSIVMLQRLKILGNCSNRQIYEYEEADIVSIFSAIERKVKGEIPTHIY